MRRIVPLLLALAPVAACKTPPQEQPQQQPAAPREPIQPPERPLDTRPWMVTDSPALLPPVDSVALERTRCYGVCPAYRLVVAKDGTVRFTSHDPGDDRRTHSVAVDPARFGEILEEAKRIGFRQLPARIEGSELCGPLATDHPTAVVTLYAADGVRRVEDYLGCHAPALKPLREFEDRIDTAAGASQWIRPMTGRKGE